ncbi:MAG TPA: GNAT family N-acetyltransferase [Thermoanaerobaculia bacterium]|nr:GNAT family N-acetyltransferase [Thermoanaerobaculia bacterium]
MRTSTVTVAKVDPYANRDEALQVIEQVYRNEKGWIRDVESEIPQDIEARADQSWYMVSVSGEPAGVIRLLYDPSLEIPEELGVELEPSIDLARLAGSGRFVEIGRFMILPRYRKDIRVALKLMKAAIAEVVERGYTHFITDVFLSDPHSPLAFHTRVLGFERIGTHRTGELACESARIILILDIARAYQRLKRRRNRVFRELGEGLRDLLEDRKLAQTA